MNVKRHARNFKTLAERRLPLDGPSARTEIEKFIEDVRLLDNTEVDLDPRSDRVLFQKKNRWWQSSTRSEVLEYSINPRQALGVREIVHKPADNSLAVIKDYSGISYKQQNKFGIQRDRIFLTSSGLCTDFRRDNGDPEAPGPDTKKIHEEIRDDSLYLKTLFSGDEPVLERLEALEQEIPQGGWERPQPHWTGPISSIRDNRVYSLIETAHRENRRFGSPEVKETVDGSGRSARTEEIVVKSGRTEEHRSNYKSVQKYWRATGQNHTGLDTEQDWSDTFLSYLHMNSNLTNPIQKHHSAEEIIETTFSNRQPWGFEFEAHEYRERKAKAPLQKGDLLVRQTPNGREFDLVTSVERNEIEVISGDYNSSVVKREIPLDPDGAPRDEGRYPGFLRLK